MNLRADIEAPIAESIATLRNDGADRLDPVRFHFLETLARRALAHDGDVRRVLEARLQTALSEYRERIECIERSTRKADMALEAVAEQPGIAALMELNRHIAQLSSPSDEGQTPSGGAQAELKSISQFRDAWSRISADKQLRQAMDDGPSNAGPLNSHLLVLRALALMRDSAPDYLDRFMPYVDALLWLDQAMSNSPPLAKKDGDGSSNKKPKPRRGLVR